MSSVHPIEFVVPGEPVRVVEVVGRLEVGRECDGEEIADPTASRRHLVFDVVNDRLTVADLGSSNGTCVNDAPITGAVALQPGDVVTLGGSRLVVGSPPAPVAPPPVVAPERRESRETIALHPSEALYETAATSSNGSGDLNEELLAECTWTDDMVAAAGIPVVDAPFVSVGGGLGSFAIVNFLRITGVEKGQIKVLSPLEYPHHTYEYLARASQIRDEDTLRSDSMSRIDNIWGFPSYALEEAWRRHTLKPLWTVLTEPILSEYYNPKAIEMYKGVEREAKRIGWNDMRIKGQARMVRRRKDGGYFAVMTPPPGEGPTKRVAYRAKHAHISVGYPSLKFLPDLQDYRTTYNDYYRVVNAYEQHDHVYEALRQGQGTVVLRGAGIVASRILERLLNDRDDGKSQTQVIHLFRTFVEAPTGPITFRRGAANGFNYQPFTYPKAAGAGQLRQKTARLQGEDRAAFIKSMGGTTTSKRAVWEKQLARARKEGWYRTEIGSVQEVTPTADGQKVRTTVKSREGSALTLDADFIIDATGLEGDIRDHRLLADLLECGGARANETGRLETNNQFEVLGTESGDGRMFASGSIVAGGSLPPSDSFWGVEHVAMEICDELAKLRFCNHLGTTRSISQWVKWMRGTQI